MRAIRDYFLYPFIADMVYAIPQGSGMEVKVRLNFGNLKKGLTGLKEIAEREHDLITPTLKLIEDSKIYNPIPNKKEQKRSKKNK